MRGSAIALAIAITFFTFQGAHAQQAPATVGLATLPPAPGVQTDRRHAMLALPRSMTGQQKSSAQAASGPNAPKMMPIYPPGNIGR